MNVHPCTDALKPILPDFEKLTGAKVTMEEVSWGELVKKLPIELSSGRPSFDVFMLNHCYPLEYARAGWVAPLDKYLNDPTLTDASWYDFADYPFGSYALQMVDGKLYGIPIANDNQILFYRKDIFADHGIEVPYTMDEMYDAGVAIKTDDMAGIAIRMKRGTGASWTWNGYVLDYGGMWIDPNNRVFLNSPQTVAGTEMYIKQAQDAGPEGALSYGWYECYNSFMQGKAAMLPDASIFVGAFSDPEQSAVVGKVGFAELPASPSGHRQPNAGNAWALAVPADAPNDKAGWLFVQWATSKKRSLEEVSISGAACRNSVWDSEELRQMFPEEWINVAHGQMVKYGATYWFPEVKGISKAMDIVDVAMQQIYTGEYTAQEALDRAHEETEKLLAKYE